MEKFRKPIGLQRLSSDILHFLELILTGFSTFVNLFWGKVWSFLNRTMAAGRRTPVGTRRSPTHTVEVVTCRAYIYSYVVFLYLCFFISVYMFILCILAWHGTLNLHQLKCF
jgi:hypothetical protein